MDNIYELIRRAEAGDANAQNNLGFCYYFGQGVKQDRKQGIELLKKAVAQGYAGAQFNLGRIFISEGDWSHYMEALELLKKSAEQGFEPAKEFLQEVEKMLNTPEKLYDR